MGDEHGMASTSAEVGPALRRSHERLGSVADGLTGAQLRGPSYCSEWSVAQVFSHLGSGAEIFTLLLDAGLRGAPAPGVEEFKSVWAAWDAKEPESQLTDALRSDAAFLDRLDALSESERGAWRLATFGAEQDLADLERHRLGEHALHTWDIAVAVDATATVSPDAVALLVDGLDRIVADVGLPGEHPLQLLVLTEDPERRFLLEAGTGGARLTPAGAETDSAAVAELPAEAFVRLVYGRLDPEHTPPMELAEVDLENLRQVFPGV